MGKLTAAQAKQLKALQAQADAPDPPALNKSVNFNIDLGDPKQVAFAIKHGLIDADDDDDDGQTSNDDDDDAAPRRKGFFGEP